MAGLIRRQLSQKLYASAWRAISSTPDEPYWSSKFPDGPKSFDEIPVVEETGYDLRKIHEMSWKFFEKYGYISKEKMLDNTWSVHLYHFQDFKTVYFNDGMFPERKSHQSMKQYRKERKDLYDNIGLGAGVGDEWWELRGLMPHGVSDILVRPLQPQLEAVADDLVTMLRNESSLGQPVELLPWLFRWAFESAGVIALGRRLNALSKDDDEADKIVEAAGITNEMIALTEMDWPNYNKHYPRLVAAQDLMYSRIVPYVEQIASEDKKCLAKTLLKRSESSKNAVTLILDIFQGALQTVPLTVLMAMYNLALNKDVQDTARREVMKIMPSIDSKYFDTVKRGNENIPPYLNGVMWETLRVNPPIIGNGRVTQKELALAGYKVPKGTQTILHHQVAGLLEENFEDCSKFKPERHPTVHQAYLEYIFGGRRRVCLGKTFSLVQMALVIAKILRCFEVSHVGEEITIINRLHNEPEGPVYFELESLPKS